MRLIWPDFSSKLSVLQHGRKTENLLGVFSEAFFLEQYRKSRASVQRNQLENYKTMQNLPEMSSAMVMPLFFCMPLEDMYPQLTSNLFMTLLLVLTHSLSTPKLISFPGGTRESEVNKGKLIGIMLCTH